MRERQKIYFATQLGGMVNVRNKAEAADGRIKTRFFDCRWRVYSDVGNLDHVSSIPCKSREGTMHIQRLQLRIKTLRVNFPDLHLDHAVRFWSHW